MRETKDLNRDRSVGGEDAVLERIRGLASLAGIRSDGLRLEMGDDAALFRTRKGCEAILTCDWFLEGTHFLREKHTPEAVGWKCLARAVSDIAAMGGVPRCFLLSLALPATHSGRWLDEFLLGLGRASRRLQCVLAGGDTTRRREILVNVTVIGEARAGRAILRSGAKPGDVLFASGRLGEAELGLHLLRKNNRRLNTRDPLLQKHLYPEPRLALGRWLAEKCLATAMMDLSDGLSTDLPRLCTASGVGARVLMEQIPAVRMPKGTRSVQRNLLNLALHGGDDYELLFTVPKRKLRKLPLFFQRIPLTAIGEITKDRSLLLIDSAGDEAPLVNRGWDPFRKSLEG
jgi:thiamine-monophosphate kinase